MGSNSGSEVQAEQNQLDASDAGREVALRSLAPSYDKSEHRAYVRHLENAIADERNRNIALTGRYGSGKSSILDHFESLHKNETVRVSINTLGPDGEGEDLTNRIQKELVKQLIYRAKPGELRRSRFARVKPLSRRRALSEAAGGAGVVVGLLWMLGALPDVAGIGADHHLVTRVIAAASFFALVVAGMWALRMIIGDRIVAQVAAVGTTVALDQQADTYFDKFLDEIVAFFEATEPQFVIFEDLDRFDDPQIFESLRELNTLINSSAHWKEKEPVRFIYAIKDSLFEQLGKTPTESDKSPDDAVSTPETVEAEPDVAVAAVERANRTKFFEVVIPVVPFISHRNARDHLTDALKKLSLPDEVISRPLMDLVARHATDMRLLVNICNEFGVFCEQLLWIDQPAPGMTADDLFALVAYKNFHLADFEAVPQRASTLDTLEQRHRDLVRAGIEQREDQKRNLTRTEALRRVQDATAATLGTRLRVFAEAVVASHGGHAYENVQVADQTYRLDKTGTWQFWKAVVANGAMTISRRQPQYGPKPVSLDQSQLTRLFPEGMDAEQWREPGAEEIGRQLQEYDRDSAFLRGADFADLVRDKRFTLEGESFADIVDKVLKSELARDLVRRGFINRNYAEYAAKFYGKFVGVDVAYFYNHSVQPNQMYLDYEFTTPDAVSNLLEQAPADFTMTVSVFNLQIVSHLLREHRAVAKEVVAFLVADFSDDAQTFLDAFMNAGHVPRGDLVMLLAEHPWKAIFEHLAKYPGIPDDQVRLTLFDTALLAATEPNSYDLGADSLQFIVDNYASMSAFTKDQSAERTKNIMDFARTADLVATRLEDLSSTLLTPIVAEHRYTLSAANLRVALGIDGRVPLDEVRKHEDVWAYCRDEFDQYLDALRSDDNTAYAVETHGILDELLTEQHEAWASEQIEQLLKMSGPDTALPDLTTVPANLWPIVVDAARMRPTAANVKAYVDTHGVDQHLADFLLTNAGAVVELDLVDAIDEAGRVSLATQFLNASATIPSATARVNIAVGLHLSPDAIEPTSLEPSNDDLLARALEAHIVPDTAETFEHFTTSGWKAVEDAFAVSENVGTFVTPALVAPVIAHLIASSRVPEHIRRQVVENLDQYVTSDDPDALRAAAQFAKRTSIKLPFDQVVRVARTTQDAELVLPHLVALRDLPSNDLMDALVSLGSPYDNLVSGPGHEFDLPPGSSNETLFKRLEIAGQLEIVKKFPRGRKVRVAL